MTLRFAGRARVAIVAVSMLVCTAACGSDDPGVERSVPVIDTSSPDTIASGGASSTTEVGAPEGAITEAEVLELEQQLDEIDRVLLDLEEQLAQD